MRIRLFAAGLAGATALALAACGSSEPSVYSTGPVSLRMTVWSSA